LPAGVILSNGTEPKAINFNDLPSFSEEEPFFEVLNIVSPPSKPDAIPTAQPRTTLFGMDAQEYECIRILLNYGTFDVDSTLAPNYSVVQYILEEIEELDFGVQLYQNILTEYRNNFKNGIILDGKHFLKNPGTQEVTVNLLIQRYSHSDGWLKHDIIIPSEIDKLPNSIYQNILRLKSEFLKIRRDLKYKKLNDNSLSKEEKDEALQSFIDYNNAIREISKILGIVVSR
jgi:DNA primase